MLVRRVTLFGVAVNIAIAASKAVAGVMSSSQALVADAVHSASDLVTDAAVLLGVRYWMAPADERHPYGHGKIEALVTVAIALVLANPASWFGLWLFCTAVLALWLVAAFILVRLNRKARVMT